jgi:endonuclease G
VQPEGEATGFLVAPSLLLTNWHVFPEKGAARGTGANFLYERNEKGIAIGITFEIDPDAFYLSNKELDYCFVGMKSRAVDGSASDNLGTIALIEATPKILIGQKVNIIEHPEGREKQYAYKNNRLLDILDQGFLHYETDTLEGSSGSPAFSEMWELVGLHHAGIPEIRDGRIIAEGGDPWNEDMGQDKVHWIANEGIRVSAIVQSLASVTLTDLSQAKILAELLASTSDPVEDIAKHLAGTSGQSGDVSQPRLDIVERLRPSGSAIGGDRVMGGHQFNFSGPVTINVYAPTAPATPAPIAAALATPAAMEKAIRFDRDYDDREGYSPDFLEPGTAALSVPPPGVSAARAGELLSGDDGAVLELKYHHFTIVMNKARRLQMWSAVNVDYDDTRRSQSGRASFGTDKWVPDPRIPERAQIFDSEIYAPAGQIDRGHIVRREDNAWGDSDKEVEFANSDTFHWTNCTPQHQAFNRESAGAKYGRKGLWGDFEQYIQKSLQQGDTKACVIAGPILAADDPKADFGLGPVQYPIKFWKIVAVAVPGAQGGKELQVFGFVLSQKDVVDDFGIEAFRPGRFAQYQVSLPEITDLTGVTFAQMLHDADTKAPAEA